MRDDTSEEMDRIGKDSVLPVGASPLCFRGKDVVDCVMTEASS